MLIPLSVLVLSGCGPKQTNSVPQSMTLSPSANVHLRNSFDTDPSSYLGRFVPDISGTFDESSAMSLSCSQHVSYRRVEGGGVRYSELLEIDTAASARLGVPLIAEASGSGSSSTVVRVSYELTGKLIGEITDPAAFADCCKAAPDQCTRRYIGEFIEGRGAIYHQAARSAEGAGSGADPSSGTNGNIEFSHGTRWERGVEFPNPVFFAFKISETPYTQQSASACTGFMTTLPPADDDGIFILGTATSPAKDEATARRRAMRDATMQAYRALAITVDPAAPDAALVLPELQAREWCVETTQTNKGERYTARALVYAPRPDTPPPAALTPSVGPAAVGTAPLPAPNQQPVVAAPAMTAPPAAGSAITASALSALKAGLDAASFSSDKQALIASAAGGYTFTVAQVSALLPSFSFDSDKVQAITALRPRITDPQNGYMLASQLTFSSDQQAVQALFQ